jgi:TATA-binding protein-associated factor
VEAGPAARQSLVVCPQTLVPHWAHEIEKFVGADVLSTFVYQGTSVVRVGGTPKS